MGIQIRAPITMPFATEDKFWYKRNKEAEPGRAKFILQKGQKTIVLEKGQPIFEPEYVEIPEEEHGETEEEENETLREAGMTQQI